MKRNKHIAILLLAVYLPMWLLSAFHVHTEHCHQHGMESEQHQQSSSESDDSSCLLCQFLHQPYEETPQIALQICLPVSSAQKTMPVCKVVAAFNGLQVSRAPPVCL
jgi:hypothetical protein